MSDVTIKQLATVLRTSPDKLLGQLKQAGMSFSNPDDVISDDEKSKLLTFLRSSTSANKPASNASGNRVTLRRRTHSSIKVTSGQGRKATSKTVNVEVRGKRTYAKRGDEENSAAALSDREEALRRLQQSREEREREAQEMEQQRLRREAKAQAELDNKKEANGAGDKAAEAVTTPTVTAEPEELPTQDKAPDAASEKPLVEETSEVADASSEQVATEDPESAKEDTETDPANDQTASHEPSATPSTAPEKTSADADSADNEEADLDDHDDHDDDKDELTHTSSHHHTAWDTPVMPHLHEKRKRKPKKTVAKEDPVTGKVARPTKKEASPERERGRRSDRRFDDNADKAAHDKKRKSGKLHLAEDGRGKRKGKRRDKSSARHAAEQASAHGFSKPTAPVVHEVPIGEANVVSDLAQKMAVKGAEVVKALFKMGLMATINQTVDHDTAVLVVEELGHKPVEETVHDAESTLLERAQSAQDEGEKTQRPPVVTIMGHVDHGKTSLLDYIRRTKVAGGEAGGITQHIGAYHVDTDRGVVTFLDTPGHAAFASMRARGAKSTDIVVLVVAADDGVKPQTIEAIEHAKAAQVPLVVAINKIDKSGANVDNVKQGLASHEVVPEDWGGDTQFIELSAKTGQGVDNLLEAISLQAEVMELDAIEDTAASGTVIEARLERGRGPVASVLVQNGTLHKGDFVVCGVEYGRMRALTNATGKQVDQAGPSIPVAVLGLSGVPASGDDFIVVADERLARQVAQERAQKQREKRLVGRANRLEDIMLQMQQADTQQVLNILVKADVHGTAEALRESLTDIGNENVKVNVVRAGVGGINESDATLASTSQALLIGFNVRADASARKVIETNDVDLRYFSIIYDVIDQVTQAASGLLGMEVREEIIGTAEVRDVFRSSKFGAVAGCMVADGVVKQSKPVRVLRDDTVIFEGELDSLRRFKDNVEEVHAGTECGIAVKAYNDVKPGDTIECFERTEVARTL